MQAADPVGGGWRPTSQTSNKFAYVTFDEPYTLVELKYMDILCQILAKPQWWVKFQDPAILAKWEAESTLSANAFGFLVHELELYIHTHHLYATREAASQPTVIPLPVHGVFMTDDLVDSDVLRAIQATTAALEAEARARRDFHPHSNDQVLDIVHPSLYCAVNGRTRLSSSKDAVVGDQVLNWPISTLYDVSNKFQWLPTPVQVDGSGSASFQSYINNIHPTDHVATYAALEGLFGKMLPLFQKCLASVNSQPLHRIATVDMDAVMPMNKFECAKRIMFDRRRQEDPSLSIDQLGIAEVWNFSNTLDPAIVPIHLPTMPENFTFAPSFPSVDLKGKPLQVIVKIASIELTPENPSYAGGSWHIEGMTNESIAATGILYYDCANITTSKLAFRHAFEPEYEFDYEQHEHTAITAVYGIETEGCDNMQVVGHVQAATGRCVVFPNFMQHCVEPFELADPTKPGHRKIVCFFLINPDHTILSTANVPPQQESWFLRSMETTRVGTMPNEALDSIKAMAGVMSHAEAKEYMLALMDERKSSSVFAKFLTEEVSLCEH